MITMVLIIMVKMTTDRGGDSYGDGEEDEILITIMT